MAEDVLDKCFGAALLPTRAASATTHLKLVGAHNSSRKISDAPGAHLYGSEAPALDGLPGADRELGGGLTEAMVRFAARHEYARTVEDVLARRSRLLFLDAALARTLAPEVAVLLQQENGVDPQMDAFLALCAQYLSLPD
jgi:glycerol-3-phosphate dehydrogenase